MTPEWDLFPASRTAFSPATFQAPGKEYRATPLWSWNNKLTEPELLQQIDELKAMGFGGFHMHTRVGLDVEYLGPEFMRLVRACVDYAKNNEMFAWLYDEDRWPSGFAGGKITEDNESFRCRHLLITPWPYGDPSHPGFLGTPRSNSAEARRSELGQLLARYAIQLDEDGYLVESRLLTESENENVGEGEQLWYVYEETNAPSEWFNGSHYVDTLNPEAMRAFVATTHETYKSAVGDEFGKTVPAIFTDEPQFAMKKRLAHANGKADVFLPWTNDLAASYQKQYGSDLFESLPEIVWDTRDASKTRYNFHDHVCERFATAFTDLFASWCTENGIGLTGHMMYEAELSTQTGSVGEAMRCYRRMQLPGIDMLCDAREYTTAKQAQSVSRQYGRCGVISEIYGVTNWTFDFNGHKGSGDWQAALGVNVRCPHLAWYSMAGEAKRDYPAAIGYQSPWFQDYKKVEDHFARIHYALARGTPAVRVAVVHPIESFWLAYGPNDTSAASKEQEQRFNDLTDWLCHGLVDFDFLSESLLVDQPVTASNKKLHFGHGHYDVVVVPALHTIRSTTLDALEKLLADGGKVVVAGASPSLVDCVPTSKAVDALKTAAHVPFSKTDILRELEGVRELRATLTRSGGAADSLLYQMREDGNDRYVFICNTDRQFPRDTQIDLRGDWDITVLDTMTGHVLALNDTTPRHTQGALWTSFPFHFDGCGSVLLRLQPKASPSSIPSGLVAFDRPEWHVAGELALNKVYLNEPNVLMLDMARYSLNDEPDWSGHAEEILRTDNIARKRVGLPLRQDNLAQPYRTPPRTLPTEHTIHLRFEFDSILSAPVTDAQIALEGLETATITLNGQNVPNTKTGWWVDRFIETAALPALTNGRHVLDISYPFDVRTNVERVYVLGSFGVDLHGRDATVVDLQLDRFRIGDWTRQQLPFYAGDVTYEFVAAPGKNRTAVQVPRFSAPVLRVEVNNKDSGLIAFPPYIVDLGDVAPSEEVTVSLTAVGNRNNAFGALHLPDGLTKWYGPDSFRTNGDNWTYEYTLQKMGVLAAPRLLTADKEQASTTWDAGSVTQDLWFH